MQVLRNAELAVSRWPNGAGRKADLLAGEGWMAGFAWLDADAPFSNLPGMDRTITLVEGPGFTLDIEGQDLAVLSRFVPARFDGGAATRCRVEGASRVLNVMTHRDLYHHEVAIVSRSGRVDPGGGMACLVVVLAGEATLAAGTELGVLDAARLGGPEDLRLGVAGCAAVVTIFAGPHAGR